VLIAELTRIRPARSRASRSSVTSPAPGPPINTSSRRITIIERRSAGSTPTFTGSAASLCSRVRTKVELPMPMRSPGSSVRPDAGRPLTKLGFTGSTSRMVTRPPLHSTTQCRGDTDPSASTTQFA
jgi:hypothetical protein